MAWLTTNSFFSRIYIEGLSEGETLMKKTIFILLISVIALSLAAYAAGPNLLRNTPNEDGEVAGFWMGLWQGLIAPITFIVSLFSKTVTVFEVHNNGGWYAFGFLLGASTTLGGSGGGAACRKKRRRDR